MASCFYLYDSNEKTQILEMNPEGYERQVGRLGKLRLERDNEKTSQTLNALKESCANGENIMPYLIDCATAYATLGETIDVMREVFGVYEEPLFI